MKKLILSGIVSILIAPLVATGQTVIFNDPLIGPSTLNGTSTPGGTPSASFTSYDVASTKTGSCVTNANMLRVKLSSGTTAGYVELQAMFASTPIQLVTVGDSINLTFSFTNSANTLLAGGAGSTIDVGLFNSGGNLPLAGSLNSAGLGATTAHLTGNCQLWQGYVAQINYNGASSTVYTRPVQNGAGPNDGVQDLLFSGAGTGLYKFPNGTAIGSGLTSGATLASGGKYTLSFTVLLSAPQTVTIINNLYTGGDTTGTLISAQTNTTAGGNTYTNFSNNYDGLAIGLANKGTSLNPTMDISYIKISTNYYFAPAVANLNNQTVIAGNNATLSPTLTGNPTPGLQWYVSTDGGVTSNAIPGATSAALTLPNVQYSQNNYQYSLVATNVLGTNAATMTLSVIVTPSITGLNNQAVYLNTDVTMSPMVSGVPAPALQWQFNGANLADGATGNGSTIAGSSTGTLSITNSQLADTGTYTLIATNIAGKVTNSMSLLVSATNVPPAITGPNNITVVQGNNGTFSASVLGLPVPTLQWLDQTQTPIGGETNPTLTLNNVQYSQNGFSYYIVASNSEGIVTNSATLSVQVPPTITAQPTNLVVNTAQPASFSVAASGVPAVAYQWKKNNTPISSAANNTATNATLVIASAAPGDIATYSCTITNLVGTTNTVSVSLIVNSLMTATAFSPANGATGLCYDTPLAITFSVAPTLRTNGTIRIYNVTNSATPVDTIDLSTSIANTAAGLSNIQAHSLFPGDNQAFSYYPIVITGSTAAIYPHGGVMTSNQTYYVTIDDGAFADSTGAYFAGITATNVWKFTTKPTGPVDPVNPIVNAAGGADFVTVQGALDSLALDAGGAHRTINIKNGTYFELVDVTRTNVTLRGQSRTGTFIKYPNNSNLQIAQGGTTHARMSFKVNANDVAIENLCLTNSTPQGGSQAEALMIETGAKRCVVNNCELDSRQDTILANVNSSQAYFYNTIIKGNFDFIWGGGNLFFDHCTIINIAGTGSGQLTAARTDTSATQSSSFPWLNPSGAFTANGMSFVSCNFQAEAGLGSITLAGSNGTAGNLVSWAFCQFAANYVTPSASLFSGNFIFWQFQNTDLTATPVSYASLITIGVTNNDPRLLAVTNIPTWFYGWSPALAPNIVSQPAGATVSQGQTTNFTVVATGIPDPTYQWQHAGTNVPGGTSATLVIANAKRSNAGSYTVIASNASGSVTSVVATLTYTGNVAPAANPSTYSRPAGYPLNIPIAGNLATNWSDADGDAPTLTGGISSTNVASVAYDSSYVHYTNMNDVADRIDYTIGDGFGGTAPGVINVTVGPPPTNSITGTVVNGNGTVTLSFLGAPNYIYQVESSTNLALPIWVPVSTNTADINGLWQFTDLQATNYPEQFYRSVYRP